MNSNNCRANMKSTVVILHADGENRGMGCGTARKTAGVADGIGEY